MHMNGSEMAHLEHSERVFERLARAPGNDHCADCKIPIAVSLGSGNLSSRFGVMLCESCGEVHRRVLRHTKVIPLCDFHTKLSQAEVLFLANRSNAAINESLEKFITPSYRRLNASAPLIIKDEFVRAKYERGEFIEERSESLKDFRGTLLKRGKNKDTWKVRWFVLSPRDSTLCYYTKEEQRVAKAKINLAEVNVTFAAEKCKRPTAMQLTYLHRGSTRNIYVAAVDDDAKTIVVWYNALRHAKLQHLRIAFPTHEDDELIHGRVGANRAQFAPSDFFSASSTNAHADTSAWQPQRPPRATSAYASQDEACATRKYSLDSRCDEPHSAAQDSVTLRTSDPFHRAFCDNLTHDFAMEGWLVKAPPRRRDAWCRRWFVLDGRKLSYYVEPLDPFPKGEIYVGSLRDSFSLVDGIPNDVIDNFELRCIEQAAGVNQSTGLSVAPVSDYTEPTLTGYQAHNSSSASFGSFDQLRDDSSNSATPSRRLTVSKSSSRSVDALSDDLVVQRSFTLLTPERTFVFVAPSAPLKARWLDALANVVCTAPHPKDNLTAVSLVRKRRADVQSLVSMLREKL